MNVKLRYNTGNTDSSVDHPRSLHLPIKKVISINGEEVEVSSLDDINIHDYASFEQEEHITGKFMSTIRRKSGGLEKVPSFKNVVKDVMRAEKIMKAMRHYSHRSDSEPEDTEDEDGTGWEPGQGADFAVTGDGPKVMTTETSSNDPFVNSKSDEHVIRGDSQRENNNDDKGVVMADSSKSNSMPSNNNNTVNIKGDFNDGDKSAMTNSPPVGAAVDGQPLTTMEDVQLNIEEPVKTPSNAQSKKQRHENSGDAQCCCVVL